MAEAKVYGGAKGSVTLTGKGAINLMVPRGVSDRITAKMIYTGPVRAPIQQGQPIGKLQVWRNDTLALEAPLQAAEDVGTGGTARRAFDAASELFIGVLRAGVGKI